MEYYVKTICTKTYLFVQQHYFVTVMISSMIQLSKIKMITRRFKVRWNWCTRFCRLDSHFNHFFPTFITQVLAEVSYPVVCMVLSWLSYLLPETAMEILRKYKRRKGEDSAGRVYFHWFCTSVFPNSNLTSSQRPIFN